MSKCTIVSLVPFEIREDKPTYPGTFIIPGAKRDDFEILVVDNVHSFMYLDENRGSLKMPIDSNEVANSIINDYENSQLFAKPSEGIGPGIFYLDGEYSKLDIKLKFKEKLEEYRQRQIRWFEVLVKVADDDWERTRQHRAISGIQRYAAKFLNLDRVWLVEPKMNKCIACKSTVEQDAVICPICKAVLNQEEYKKLQFVEK